MRATRARRTVAIAGTSHAIAVSHSERTAEVILEASAAPEPSIEAMDPMPLDAVSPIAPLADPMALDPLSPITAPTEPSHV
jgi:hypothetical protein